MQWWKMIQYLEFLSRYNQTGLKKLITKLPEAEAAEVVKEIAAINDLLDAVATRIRAVFQKLGVDSEAEFGPPADWDD